MVRMLRSLVWRRRCVARRSCDRRVADCRAMLSIGGLAPPVMRRPLTRACAGLSVCRPWELARPLGL
eukprot:9469642-Pyramimonas_sp.AAC.1